MRATDPNTNGSQFFVGLSREGTKHLDGRYAAFGEAVRGSRVILALAAVKVGEADRPLKPPRIRSAPPRRRRALRHRPPPLRRPPSPRPSVAARDSRG